MGPMRLVLAPLLAHVVRPEQTSGEITVDVASLLGVGMPNLDCELCAWCLHVHQSISQLTTLSTHAHHEKLRGTSLMHACSSSFFLARL